MRYARSLDPMERADAIRQLHYDAFDRCVATLPAEKAALVDLLGSGCDNDGNWQLRDVAGSLVALVRDPAAPPRAVSEEPEPTSEPQPARAKLNLREHDKKLLRAVGRRMNSLHELTTKGMADLAELITVLAKRIKELETKSAIDSEAISTTEQISERVDAIEQRGFRFVGKYQAPATYGVGDVVSYKGALWNCVAAAKVGDRPNTASHKWALMISGIQE